MSSHPRGNSEPSPCRGTPADTTGVGWGDLERNGSVDSEGCPKGKAFPYTEYEQLGLCSGSHHPYLGSITKQAKHQDPASAPSLAFGKTPVPMPDVIVPLILVGCSLSLRNVSSPWAHPEMRMWNISIPTAPSTTAPIPLSAGDWECLEPSSARTNSSDAQFAPTGNYPPPSLTGN